jgi:hypothetical protein
MGPPGPVTGFPLPLPDNGLISRPNRVIVNLWIIDIQSVVLLGTYNLYNFDKLNGMMIRKLIPTSSLLGNRRPTRYCPNVLQLILFEE